MTQLLRSVNQKAPEETPLNKPNSCQYSILELRRNTTSYGPISNPQLSTSGTDGATCLYDPKNILWQHIFSQPYAVLWVIENTPILGHPLGIDLQHHSVAVPLAKGYGSLQIFIQVNKLPVPAYDT